MCFVAICLILKYSVGAIYTLLDIIVLEFNKIMPHTGI